MFKNVYPHYLQRLIRIIMNLLEGKNCKFDNHSIALLLVQNGIHIQRKLLNDSEAPTNNTEKLLNDSEAPTNKYRENF